jgi:glutamine synthetase
MERNLYNLTAEEREKMGIESLPAGPRRGHQGGRELRDPVQGLGEHCYSRLLEVKRAEFEEYRVQITPYELEKYLPIL